MRTDLLERYAALPFPTTTDEPWRFTDLRGFDPDAYEAAAPVLTLSEAELPEGVGFGRLAQAVEEVPELVERHFGSVVSDDEKFAAGNAAGWQDGVFLHVHAGIELEAPLRATVEIGEAVAVSYRALIVLERGARAVFSEEFVSTAPGMVNAVVELSVGDGARLEYVTTQRHHAEARQRRPRRRAGLGRAGAGRHPRQVPHGELPGRPRRPRQGHRCLLPGRP